MVKFQPNAVDTSNVMCTPHTILNRNILQPVLSSRNVLVQTCQNPHFLEHNLFLRPHFSYITLKYFSSSYHGWLGILFLLLLLVVVLVSLCV